MPPALPPELIAHIINLTLPPLALDTFQERYDVLLRLHLVNEAWTPLARKLLLEHVRIRSPSTTSELFDSCSRQALVDMFGRTSTLWLGSDRGPTFEPFELGFYNIATFAPVTRYFNALQFVVCRNLEAPIPTDLWPLQGVPRLSLQNFTFGITDGGDAYSDHLTTVVQPFKYLTHLTLLDCFLHDSVAPGSIWGEFLNPITFPALKHFNLLFEQIEGFYGELSSGIVAIAPQLESFAWAEGGRLGDATLELGKLFQYFNNLKSLHLALWYDEWEPTVSQLGNLPASSPLLSLSFGATEIDVALAECFEVLTTLFNSSPPFATSLRTITFYGWPERSSLGEPRYDEALAALKAVLESRDIVLEIKKASLEFPGSVVV